jgi:hypothetical protein
LIWRYINVVNNNNNKSSETIGTVKWQNLESKAKLWSGLDRFGDIHETTSWKDGPESYYMHNTCYLGFSSTEKLYQAQKAQGQRKCEAKL